MQASRNVRACPELKAVPLSKPDELALLAAIVETSRDAIVSRSLDGTIMSWNRAAEQLYGYSAEEAIGRSLALIIVPEFLPKLKANTEALLTGRPVDPFYATQRRRDGGLVHVSVSVSPIKDESGAVVGVASASRDVSRERELQAALREGEHDLADFFEGSPLGLLWVGPDGAVLRANRAQHDLLGCARDQPFDGSVADWFAEPEVAEDLLGRLAARETVNDARARLRRKDGAIVHVLIDANGLWRNGALVHSRWFVRDITRRIELEREIITAVENEQRRFGMDLHDDLCQQISGAEFLVQTLATELAGISDSGAKRAEEIAKHLRASIDHARELAQGLSPVGIEGDGLVTALRGLAQRTRKVFRRECVVRCPHAVNILDHGVSMHLFRIAQEAVNNAIRHGKARRIEIGLAMNNDRVVVAVRDDGIGISRRPRRGLGLRIMRYRAGMINASLLVQRRNNGGTEVVCAIDSELPREKGTQL